MFFDFIEYINEQQYKNAAAEKLVKFNETKKELIKQTKQKMNNFKLGCSKLKSLRIGNLNGQGDYFTIYQDDMHTTIERTKIKTSDNFKTFGAAKKEAKKFFKTQIDEYRADWKSLINLNFDDVAVADEYLFL